MERFSENFEANGSGCVLVLPYSNKGSSRPRDDTGGKLEDWGDISLSASLALEPYPTNLLGVVV